MTPIVIRPATVDDVDDIFTLAESLRPPEDGNGSGGFLVSEFRKDDYARWVGAADFFYVATRDSGSGVAGFILAYSDDQIDPDDTVNAELREQLTDFVVIKQIAVDRSFGRHGVAGQLYEHVQALVGERQIVAAVVADPPNEPSIRFHRKRGFSPMTELVGADGRRRTIWRLDRRDARRTRRITTRDDHKLHMAQYKRAIQLYQHEDRLNWEKLRNYVYVSVALVGATGFIILSELDNADDVAGLRVVLGIVLAMIGLLASFGYYFALQSGVRYLNNYKQRINELEDALSHEDHVRLIDKPASHTMKLLKFAPVVGSGVWIVIVVLLVILVAQ